MEFVVDEEGFMAERSIHELAAWYSEGGPDHESFEAHLMVLKAANSLITSAQRGRRTSLSAERYGLLRLLYRTPDGRLLMGDIGRGLEVSPASVTKLVDGLAALELVRRVADYSDHRRTWVEITEAGSRLVEESMPSVKHYTQERWKALSREEKRLLIHLLSKLMLSAQSSQLDRRLAGLTPLAGAAASRN